MSILNGDSRNQLFDLLLSRSFKKGNFILASGQSSDFYLDIRMTSVSPLGVGLIGEVFYEEMIDLEFDAIGGLQVGAVPLITAAVRTCHDRGKSVEGFWVRDTQKAHGTGKKIEGALRPNARVIIVEDVCTTGQSTLKAVEAVREIGCQVLRVVALVDRQQGAGELFWRNFVDDFRSIYTIEDFTSIEE
jgi:orotate phosphoribosyltransferase